MLWHYSHGQNRGTAVEKIAIISKPKIAIVTVNDHGIIWLQYTLQKLLSTEVVFFSWEEARTADLHEFSWVICDCSTAQGERRHVEELLSRISWHKGKTIVRFGSTRPFEGEIDGVKIFKAQAKALEYVAFIQAGSEA